MREKKKPMRIWTIYDTETSNYTDEAGTAHAFPMLYIFNDVHKVPMSAYELDDRREHVTFVRYEAEAVEYIERVIQDAAQEGYVPIVCVYNMIFDVQTILWDLHERYEMVVNAQSSTNVYTLDLMRDDACVMRFWDTYHLEMRGLKAMGRTCGVDKLMGDWDYDLVRTPETELTQEELGYAKRDVQVIPAYLRYLCDANEWLYPDMLGVSVLTKTSLVRQMAKAEIGRRTVPVRGGKPLRLRVLFEALCARELPTDYDSYALRLACFRGGLTFTAACVASRVVRNVYSLDETSAHHAWINGRRVPVAFEPLEPRHMRIWIYDLTRYSMRDVLHRYHFPFQRWFHMCVRITGLRLRSGSAFEHWGIALLAQAKFSSTMGMSDVRDDNERHIASVEDVRARGFVDSCVNPTYAFSKLYAADECTVHVCELELWCMMQVYEWDSIEPLYGEGTLKSIWPPDYVALQSNMLFERKSDAKRINEHYRQGEPYTLDIPASVPASLAEQIRAGELTNAFIAGWYGNSVKGQFNGIYGVQAQNVLKPEYAVGTDAELYVNQATKATPDNYDERIGLQKHPSVLYTYGMRIVGGSRMQLVIAIMLLYEALGERITVTGGDTDSIKVRCDADVTESDLLSALEPLHAATTAALDASMARMRRQFPDLASSLTHIGCFEIEPASRTNRAYDYHMEAWPKARISIDGDGRPHVTCAGLSRPDGAYTIEAWISGMLTRGFDVETVLKSALGYNVTITNDVCHALDHHKPLYSDTLHRVVTDYKGDSCQMDTHEAIALYDTSRRVGDTLKRANAANVAYLEAHGRDIDTSEKVVTVTYDYIYALAVMLMGPAALCPTVRRHFLANFATPRLYRQEMSGMVEVLPCD